MGSSSRRPHRVPLRSDKNSTRRIQFTQTHQNWTIEDCKNVAWSRFLLRHSDVLLVTMSIPLWLQCTIFWCTSSRIMHCHKAQIILDWFLEHDNEFTFLKWPPQSPDLNSIEHLWDVVKREIHIMDVQPTNLQQLRDAIMPIWTKISEQCFQHLVESVTKN